VAAALGLPLDRLLLVAGQSSTDGTASSSSLLPLGQALVLSKPVSTARARAAARADASKVAAFRGILRQQQQQHTTHHHHKNPDELFAPLFQSDGPAPVVAEHLIGDHFIVR
jgi:hypothetical protein